MPRVNLKSVADKLLAEEQAGFRTASTVEQILYSSSDSKTSTPPERDLVHNCIDFKKAFDGVWHESGSLWHFLR